MQVNELKLKHFRNYDQEKFIFDPHINILIGNNAQGKTNVLEAIYLLSTTRSFRTHKIKELIQFESEFGFVEGQVESNKHDYDMRVVVSKQGKKAFINRKDIARTSDYIGYLNAILFVPEDLSLVKGSPSARRQLLDQEISKISPIYMYNITKYHKLLKERNAFLKMLKEQHKEGDLYLDVLSEQLAELSADLIKRRMDFVALLNEMSGTMYDYLSADEKLTVSYHTSYKEISKEAILAKYHKTYKRDIIYMSTVDGLHKDDLKFQLNNNDASLYASQGQQRSIVLAIKTALLEIVKKEIGEYPILLLDDVLSELDDQRKMKMMNLIDHKVQTFITTTSIEGMQHASIAKAKKIKISHGNKEDI